MGLAFSKLLGGLLGRKEIKIVMLGLDNAGKTTILQKLGLGEVTTITPTIGLRIKCLQYKNISFTAMDLGSADKIQPMRRHFYRNLQAIIWVMDSADIERVEEVREELHRQLGEEFLRDPPLLLLANKHDLPNAMDEAEIKKCLRLGEIKDRSWHIVPTCATSGAGLYEGFEWLGLELPKFRGQ
ncbi:ADP-ribosylation factor [Xylariales sp. PMI_506]|nr:ADP-ribosylation factor [Xylariales sp. PMI_506]